MNDLLDWLGAGGVPVSQDVAERRALVCESCPENRAKRWWEWALDPIADCIKSRLEVKTAMNLAVPNEDKLNMCRVCGCCARLKVWCPSQYISNKSHFPEHCWIRKES